MDKSESEILEEWDLVSSVYDTEQENNMTEKKTDDNIDTSANGNETSANDNETNTNGVTVTSISADTKTTTDVSIKNTETDTEETADADASETAVVGTSEITDTNFLKTDKPDIENTAEETINDDAESVTNTAAEEAVDTDTSEVVKTASEEVFDDDVRETVQVHSQEEIEADTGETIKAHTEETTEVDNEEVAEGDVEDGTDADIEETAEADTEEASEPETEEITVIETIMYDVKKFSDIGTERATKTEEHEKIPHADIEDTDYKNIEKTYNVDTKSSEDTEIQECDDTSTERKIDVDTIYNSESNIEHEIDAGTNHSAVDNHDDYIVNSSLDSSMEHIQMEQCEGSCIQNLPELIPKLDLTEQENAAIESSSSDIDIIDENMEESVTRSFIHPLSLSISSAVDTSSILSSTSDDDKSIKIEEDVHSEKPESHSEMIETLPKTSEVYAKKLETYSKVESCAEKSETVPKRSNYEYQRYSHEERSENIRHSESQGSRRESQRSHPEARGGIIGILLQFLRNLTPIEWSLLSGVVIGLYFVIIFNHINIFAFIERNDVVFQMKDMIEDLKHDNKLLKDQMLSEMKNDKVLSSFEHQLKELRKENSRLNHMLFDVAKVLEKQKDSHERFAKKEAEYLAPFKKEINTLKEHINILKFDNEELQKQLVRMRYSSYSQGGKDTSDEKGREQKEGIKADEANLADEIPLDINSLKKWNELISLLSKELGLLSENDPLTKEKYQSETIKNISWYWKIFLKEFKGTFDEFKANITSKFLDYKKVHENTVSGIYKSVKNFFTVEEQNKQTFVPPGEESSQWKNIGDFFNDLKDKWTKIKNRIDTSDLKNIFKEFKRPGNAKTSQEYSSEKSENSAYEYNERKPTNVHFETDRKPTTGHFESERKPTNIHYESSRKPTNVHFESDKKHDKVQSDSEDTKWMFERAALRAELRDTEKNDDSVNWFLKKNKHLSKDDTEKK